MKLMKTILCSALCASMIVGSASISASAAVSSQSARDYTIHNPYENVNWDTANQYKTALHTHTNASDGDITLKESIETHVLQGFDIVATTDHGINNNGWASAEDSNYKFVHTMLKLFGRNEGDLVYLGTEGKFDKSGLPYVIVKENGDEYLKVTQKDGSVTSMMRVPHGIENNAISINAHVNSWFVNYQDNNVNDYINAIKGVSKAGAICVINHPGEYTKAKEDLTSEEAYNLNNWAYRYYINKFYGLIERYPACIGIDMNSKGDSRTRYDRELWDILLERLTPSGRNVLAIASSDAHQSDKINTGYIRLLMNEKNSAEARKALEDGAFFACSYCNGNHDELVNILQSLEKFYGKTSELYATIKAVVDRMDARINGVATGTEKPDQGPTDPLRLIDQDGYFHGKDTFITKVEVNNDTDSITLHTENALLVRWIANGKVIAVTKADSGSSTLNLSDYTDEIGTYVRAEAFGEGGVIYTQAFVLSYDGQPEMQKYPYVNIPVIDALFAEVRNLQTIMKRTLNNLFSK